MGSKPTSSDDSTIQGNLIGTDQAGTSSLGNGATGVWLNNSSRFAVGGTASGAGNVIVRQRCGLLRGGHLPEQRGQQHRSWATGSASARPAARCLTTGSASSSTAAANANQIGSTATGGGNVIANNFEPVWSSTGGATDPRQLDLRQRLPRDRPGRGRRHVERPGDLDFGANRPQNFPVLRRRPRTPAARR